MECLNPITLKNGYIVPCGKCTLCQSKIRTEKSVLVQLHCDSFERMPLFIGLSYDEDHLPRYCTCPTEQRFDHAPHGSHARFYRKDSVEELKLHCTVPSLYRRDVSSFLKSYKRLTGLDNKQFTYFGCGEYGDTYDRPHYHLIWFGDTNLEKMYDSSVHSAERWLAEFWQHGHVDINVAEWSGIHYVTKYCLKDNNNYPDGAMPPFTISSNGIGLGWLKSYQAQKIKQQLLYLQFNKDKIFADIDLMSIPFQSDDRKAVIQACESYIERLRPVMPDFRVTLPSGSKCFLPRKLRSKLLGSYEHFSDNPLWVYEFLQNVVEEERYLLDHGEYDSTHDVGIRKSSMEMHAYSVQRRINRNKVSKK